MAQGRGLRELLREKEANGGRKDFAVSGVYKADQCFSNQDANDCSRKDIGGKMGKILCPFESDHDREGVEQDPVSGEIPGENKRETEDDCRMP